MKINTKFYITKIRSNLYESSFKLFTSSIKKLRYNKFIKWQILLFLILIFNCFGRLNGELDDRDNLPFNNLYSLNNTSNESIFTKISSYLMSFLNLINNTDNQVINQLSIYNQPSNLTELELFKNNGSQINESSINLLNLENNLNYSNSINGHKIPLHQLMFKDELKLFLNNYEEIDGLNYLNSSQQDNYLISEINNQLNKSLDEDYELIEQNEISFYPNILSTKFKLNPNKLKLTFNLFNKKINLFLQLNEQLFAPNFTIQKSSYKKLTKNLKLNNLNCFYHGRLETDLNRSSNNIVSLSICDGIRGFIQTTNYLYLINPLTEQLIKRFNLFNKLKLNKDTLFIRRLKNKDLISNLAKQITNQSITKMLNNQKNQIINSQEMNHFKNSIYLDQQNSKKLKRTKRFTRLDYHNPTIELACFVDESLYNYLKNTYFIKSDHQIVQFILTILNGIQTLYNQFQKYDINLKFSIVLLSILKEQPKDLIPSDLQEKYIFSFCDWQLKKKFENSKYSNFDHAILLTALDLARYDKETNVKLNSVIGSSLVGRMCTESSCSIGEATSLGTILVMAHEIGHSMDLSHDGDMQHSGTNNCENEKFIMTTSLGPGVYSFSKCSARELKNFLKTPNAKCLFVNNSKLRLNKKFLKEFNIKDEDDVLGSWEKSKFLPGQQYSIDEQCSLQFGEKSFYAPTKYYSFCEAVTCKLNSSYEGIRYAHPTLENTMCGYEKWCKKGECIKRSNLKEIDLKADILNNEILSSNPYSIDLSIWKLNKPIYSINALNKTLSKYYKTKPKWKIFENNYDTSIDKKLLNNKKNINNTINIINNLNNNLTIFKTNLTNHWISLFDNKKENNSIIKSGWSNWSNWSECVSNCIVTDNQQTPVGFQISTRKCYSGSINKKCLGTRIRLKLCNTKNICSKTKTLDQYVNSVCDTNLTSSKSRIDQCFVKNCSNNELILSHELQLPNTSPCSTDQLNDSNSYCYNGECKSFDCSGYSEADTDGCKNKTTVDLTKKDIKQNLINDYHPISYCKQSCLINSRGMQLAYHSCNGDECNLTTIEKKSFQLCMTAEEDCLKKELKTVTEYANEICLKFKKKFPSLLSGKGRQLTPNKDNPNSACYVSCSDLKRANVFYSMNIQEAKFPLGTNCTFNSPIQSYCINGKCVQFDLNDFTPIDKSVNNFKNLRKEFFREMMHRNRHRRR